jgi:hypothetical protein
MTDGACGRRRGVHRQWPGGGLLVVGVALVFGSLVPAQACDLCAIYTATEQRESRPGPLVGLAEQYSDYSTLQEGGHEVDNPANERLQSSITQLLLGYRFTPRLAVQMNLPVIVREFRRQEESGIVDGEEDGIGDLSLVGSATVYTHVMENGLVRLVALGGLKLPSGDSSRIKEELSETHHDGSGTSRPVARHADHTDDEPDGEEVVSGIHGHDLALGSGSVDGIIGAQVFGSWRRAFFSGAIQYLLRTEGDFDYQYANDLMWSGGPGAFVWLRHDYSIGAQAMFTGESKGKDTLSGAEMDDTAITALYVGPALTFTWGTSLGADLSVDLPVIQNNSALQIVPDYRLRGGATWRF